jgi:hypothetical protein
MDLALGLSFVLLERRLQILRLRSLRHLRSAFTILFSA